MISPRLAIPGYLVVACAVAELGSPPPASAQQFPCHSWEPQYSPLQDLDDDVTAIAEFDDGSGPQLYVAGEFHIAGSEFVNGLARFDGMAWHGVPGLSVINEHLRCLAVYDDGTGPALYAGGDFSILGGVPVHGIARWNGSSWSDVGGVVQGAVSCFAVYDDGTGLSLDVGGSLATAGGVSANGVARWNGVSWSPLGVAAPQGVSVLTVHDDGSGSVLVAGGAFNAAGGLGAGGLATWDGARWTPFGGDMTVDGDIGGVRSLASFGGDLYVGGNFTRAGTRTIPRIARWNGSDWSALGSGVDGAVNAMTTFTSGGATDLYVGGDFHSAGGQPRASIARWDGTFWSSVGPTGLSTAFFGVRALATSTSGSLYAGGGFDLAEHTPLGHLGKWDGREWTAVGTGMAGARARIVAIGEVPTGPQRGIYVGGRFTGIGDASARRIARWDGESFAPLGAGIVGDVHALESLDDGSGAMLVAGGVLPRAGGVDFANVARWNGTAWSPVGSGTDGDVRVLLSSRTKAGPVLYAAGDFVTAGGAPANRIAAWDGSGWSPLGGGFEPAIAGTYATVRALATFDDGSGPALFAAGQFALADGMPASNIARWDGTAWSDVGAGLSSEQLDSLAVFDDGSGPALFAGGRLTIGLSLGGIARWNGTSWSAVGDPLAWQPEVSALTVFDDGDGPALYAGGAFQVAGPVTLNAIARWNGSVWAPLGTGVEQGTVAALRAYDDGNGPALYAGGKFTVVGGVVSVDLARWTTSFDVRRGTVNSGLGPRREVLAVNGSPGDGWRRSLSVRTHSPISIALAAPPAGPDPAEYALWIWNGASARPTPTSFGGATACSIAPTPFALPLEPQPMRCFRSAGAPPVACAGQLRFPGPAAAPFSIVRPNGIPRARAFLIQGIVQDSGGVAPYSLTNAVEVRVVP
jgi:hypothetical protein